MRISDNAASGKCHTHCFIGALKLLAPPPATSEPMRAGKALELDPPPQFPRPLSTESPDKLV